MNSDLTPTLLGGTIDTTRMDSLYNRVSDHIDIARQRIQRSIDTEMVKAYWLIGIWSTIIARLTIVKSRCYGLSQLSNCRA